MAQAWYFQPVTQAHGQNGEKGIDLGMPVGTPITALYAGTVTWAGRTQWACGSSGGEVVIVCNVPGRGTFSSYYLHMNTVNVKTGDKVNAGQVIATSGGQLSGGTMPVVNCVPGVPGYKGNVVTYSTGPHMEFGFNAPWVSGPGTNIDPTFAINAARAGTLGLPTSGVSAPVTTQDPDDPTVGTLSSSSTSTPLATSQQLAVSPLPIDAAVQALASYSAQTHRVVTRLEGWDSIATVLQDTMQTPNWNSLNPFGSFFSLIKPWSVRLLLALFGVAIIIFVLWEYIRTAQQSIQSVVVGSGGGGSGATPLGVAPEAAAL